MNFILSCGSSVGSACLFHTSPRLFHFCNCLGPVAIPSQCPCLAGAHTSPVPLTRLCATSLVPMPRRCATLPVPMPRRCAHLAGGRPRWCPCLTGAHVSPGPMPRRGPCLAGAHASQVRTPRCFACLAGAHALLMSCWQQPCWYTCLGSAWWLFSLHLLLLFCPILYTEAGAIFPKYSVSSLTQSYPVCHPWSRACLIACHPCLASLAFCSVSGCSPVF